MLTINSLVVGSFEANCYLLEDSDQSEAILIDPGAEPDKILDWIRGVRVVKILITHGHADHVGALAEVRQETGCPVGGHKVDADRFGLNFDFTVEAGSTIELGSSQLEVYEIPGHTPGSIALALREETFERAIVGDAIFPGGPGHTRSHDDLKTLLGALERTVFEWPDRVTLYPGHGGPTTVGAERQAFRRLIKQELSPDLFGDVTWR